MTERTPASSVIAAVVSMALLCAACSSKPAPPARHDPSSEAWYGTATKELTELSLKANTAYAEGKLDAAAALIEQGKAVSTRLLSVPRPSLGAAEAASDLDDLYGRMLFRNRHFGWARLQFQKNVARWKHWQPQTTETARRLSLAQTAIGNCDRALETQ